METLINSRNISKSILNSKCRLLLLFLINHLYLSKIGLGEVKIRDLNDRINKLLKEKK